MKEPVFWRKATCEPCGAAGLPEVNGEPFAVTPEPLPGEPENVQADPLGSYR